MVFLRQVILKVLIVLGLEIHLVKTIYALSASPKKSFSLFLMILFQTMNIQRQIVRREVGLDTNSLPLVYG